MNRGKRLISGLLYFLLQHFAYIWSHMVIEGEANEFLNLLFGEFNEKRFAQVIKVKIFKKNNEGKISRFIV